MLFQHLYFRNAGMNCANPETMEQGFQITGNKKITGLNTSFQVKSASQNKRLSSLLSFKCVLTYLEVL